MSNHEERSITIRIAAQEGAGPDGPTSGEERSALFSRPASWRGLLSRSAV
jgi:hypothetical protein